MLFTDLNGDQARQTIDTEQVFGAYVAARTELDHRYAGSMAWKTVGSHTYLYRKRQGVWKSLGARSSGTEEIHRGYHEGRADLQDRIANLSARMDAMAPVNRALRLGRMPIIAARVLRRLTETRLYGPVVGVVGTNALYAYERLAGVQIAGPQLATGDIDLLYDARKSLRLVAPEAVAGGLLAELRKVDRSFTVIGNPGFRAVNRDGYLVDLIMPAGKDPIRPPVRNRIGSASDELQAVEIEGLAWLVNSPKTAVTAIDARGYPVQMWVIDPRAFALHKAWLSTRGDRDPLKRTRDAAQADLVASLIRTRLPRLPFDDPALRALPRALRDLADTIGKPPAPEDADAKRSEPDW
jgi:hypothetical protein